MARNIQQNANNQFNFLYKECRGSTRCNNKNLLIFQSCFGQFFAHPPERKTVFYSMWYNAPKLMPAGGLERGGTDYVFGVKDVVRTTSFTPNT